MLQRLWKLVTTVVVIAVLGWVGWWFIGAKGQEAAIAAWFENQRERGWQAEAAAIEVTGFPIDFNTRIAELHLADPQNGWSWKAPELSADSKTFQPTRINVTWPTKHSIAVPGERADVTAKSMTSVMDLRPGPAMELREASVIIDALVIKAQSGWTASTAGADIKIAERPDDLAPPNSYDVLVTANTVVLPKELVQRIDPTGWLKPSVDTVTVKGHAAFDDPIDRSVVEDGRIAMRAATIREAGFEWGEMRLIVKGAIKVDDDGYPVGEIKVEAREWRQMVRLAVSSGVIDRGTARSITKGVEFLTALTGGGDDLSAPLGLSGGKVRLGPFAIADAPRLAPPR
ncbi:MAG: DUF2125 domain-containing protein [Pseudomonadota bacterium]